MDRELLQEKIIKRSAVITNNKINSLRQDITKAFIQFGINELGYRHGIGPKISELLKVIISDKPNLWPAWVFDRDITTLEEEILSTMNALQQTLLTKDVELEEQRQPEGGDPSGTV